jgi:hypothetical protein
MEALAGIQQHPSQIASGLYQIRGAVEAAELSQSTAIIKVIYKALFPTDIELYRGDSAYTQQTCSQG